MMNGALAGASHKTVVSSMICSTREYGFGTWQELKAQVEGLAERARYVAEDRGEVVILGGLAAGYVELTAWTRGFTKFYPDFVTNLDMLTYLMDTIIALKLAYWDIALPMVGKYADVVQEADDVAGQYGLLMKPETYREIIKPRHKKIFDFIKARSEAKIFFHCCGSVREIIPDLVEIGVDIINPVQVSATVASPSQMSATAAENIMAMWETLQEYGDYGPGGVGQRPEEYVYSEPPEKPLLVSVSPDSMPARALTAEEATALAEQQRAEAPALLELRTAIIEGNAPAAVDSAGQLLLEGMEPQDIITGGVMPAMEVVGNNFETGEFYLPEMMASAIATRGIMNLLRPKLTETDAKPVAKAALGTVKGDLHDIGKNLVGMMWEGAGFQVFDLGPDVPPEKFIAAIEDDKVDLIGMSALLTTTMPMMGTTIEAITAAGVRDQVKLMVPAPMNNLPRRSAPTVMLPMRAWLFARRRSY